MEHEILKQHLENGVLTLTMDRPERRNAISLELGDKIMGALDKAATNPDVGVIILTGANGNFCVGGDVKSMAAGTRPGSFEERVYSLRSRMDVSTMLHESPKPTIAMVRGAVAGAGLSMALACDLRVASETIKMTTAFAKVGLSGDFGGTYFLSKLVGTAKAREMYFMPEIMNGQQAHALGLVSRVVADKDLEAETMKVARALADGPRVTISHMKANFNLAERGTLAQVMDSEAIRHVRCTETEDHKEAAAAFVEKRAARFKGR